MMAVPDDRQRRVALDWLVGDAGLVSHSSVVLDDLDWLAAALSFLGNSHRQGSCASRCAVALVVSKVNAHRARLATALLLRSIACLVLDN